MKSIICQNGTEFWIPVRPSLPVKDYRIRIRLGMFHALPVLTFTKDNRAGMQYRRYQCVLWKEKQGESMKYNGIYWSLFAPMMKKSILTRFGESLAERSIREGKKEYRRLLSRADDLGPGNPMASNAYFAYVFAAAWLGSGRKIKPDEMALVMTDVLESRLLRFVFGMTDLNRQPKKWYRDMKKYEAWFNLHGQDYPVNWNVNFDESRHRDGSYYYFSRCPIYEFCKREGIAELMPALCATDEVMFRLQHGKLYREHTIASGEPICDYWVVGDRIKIPE